MHDQVFADIVYQVNLPTGSTLGITEADINTYQKNATEPLSNHGGEFGGFEKIPADLRLGFSKDTAQSKLTASTQLSSCLNTENRANVVRNFSTPSLRTGLRSNTYHFPSSLAISARQFPQKMAITMLV
jgi:hypothetical protein